MQALYAAREPLSVQRLGELLDADAAEVAPAVTELEESGHLLREEDMIVAVSGLSVVPTRHELRVNGVSYWTWCPWDALGLATLLGGTGEVRTTCPDTQKAITVHFADSEITVDTMGAVLLFPQVPEDCVTVRDWCPNVNLFESPEDAQSWMASNGVDGTIQDLRTAARDSADSYRPKLDLGPSRLPWWLRLLRSLHLRADRGDVTAL
jgi:hypothetical protein